MSEATGDVRLASYSVFLTQLLLDALADTGHVAELGSLHATALDSLGDAQRRDSDAEPPASVEGAAASYFGSTVDALQARYASRQQADESARCAAEASVAHAGRLVAQTATLRQDAVEPLLAHLLAEAAQRLAEAHAARRDWHGGSCEYARWAMDSNLAFAQRLRAEAEVKGTRRFSAQRRAAQAEVEMYAARGRQSSARADAVGLSTMIDDALAAEARAAAAMVRALHRAAMIFSRDCLLNDVPELLGDTEAKLASRVSTLRSVKSHDAVSRLGTELRLLREAVAAHL